MDKSVLAVDAIMQSQLGGCFKGQRDRAAAEMQLDGLWHAGEVRGQLFPADHATTRPLAIDDAAWIWRDAAMHRTHALQNACGEPGAMISELIDIAACGVVILMQAQAYRHAPLCDPALPGTGQGITSEMKPSIDIEAAFIGACVLLQTDRIEAGKDQETAVSHLRGMLLCPV